MFAMQTKDRAAPIVGKSGIEKGVIVKILHKSTYEGRLATVMDPDFEGRVRSVSSNHFTFLLYLYCVGEYQSSVLSRTSERISIEVVFTLSNGYTRNDVTKKRRRISIEKKINAPHSIVT